MRNKAGIKCECIFEELLDYIDIDYTHLNKTVRYEKRPHGELIFHDTYTVCGNCGKHYCGALMISSNSETEKSKSEIVPDYRDGWRLKEGEAE